MSKRENTRPHLAAVPATDEARDTAMEVERAAYRAAASVAVLHEFLLNCGGSDDRVRMPAAVLADFVEGIDRELDFVTDHIGSMRSV